MIQLQERWQKHSLQLYIFQPSVDLEIFTSFLHFLLSIGIPLGLVFKDSR